MALPLHKLIVQLLRVPFTVDEVGELKECGVQLVVVRDKS
jgi:hypothetical protein